MSGHAVSGGVHIQPEVAGTDHLDNQHGRELLKRECVTNTAAAVFEGANAPLSHRDMLLAGALVEGHAESGE